MDAQPHHRTKRTNKLLAQFLCLFIPHRRGRRNVRSRLCGAIYSKVNDIWSLRHCCDIQQDISALLEKGTIFSHPVGIVIAGTVAVGRNVTISQNVTIGLNPLDPELRFPTIEDNVIIRANSVIYGGITIGENSIIAPNSVVIKDIPANEVWAGNPARFLKKIQA